MSVGRPLQYNPEQALNEAMLVFWQQGYTATSLDDLLKSMQLSKSSFYQAFKSKHRLFLQCIMHYVTLTSHDLNSKLTSANSGKEFIVTVFNSVINDDRKTRKGCLVSNTASEFAQVDPQVAKLVKKSMMTFKGIFKKAIITGQQDGSICKKIEAEQLAGYLVASLNGIRTMVKAGIDQATLRGMVGMIETNLNKEAL